MSHGKLPCPECQTMNDAPAEGTKKITCSSCGMILVLNKIYGDNWPAQAKKHGQPKAAPSKPQIKSRRQKTKSGESETERPSRKSKGSSRRRTTTRGKSRETENAGESIKDRTTRRKASQGMSQGMIFGSIGLVIVVGVVLAFMVNKRNEEAAAKEKEVAAAELAKKEKAAAKRKAEEEEDNSAENGVMEDANAESDPATHGEIPVAAKSTKKVGGKLKKKRGRKQDPFPIPEMEADVKASLEKAVATLMDLDATREQREADATCFEHRKKAIPLLINALMGLDSTKEDDCRKAWPLMDTLRRCSEWSTKYDRNLIVMEWPDDEDEVFENAKDREIIILDWWKWWNKNSATWKPPVESLEDF